jgi:hypothetical protein
MLRRCLPEEMAFTVARSSACIARRAARISTVPTRATRISSVRAMASKEVIFTDKAPAALGPYR